MPQDVFSLDKPPLTTEQLAEVALTSKVDIWEWLFLPAIPFVFWVSFKLVPFEGMENKILTAAFISLAVSVPFIFRAIDRSNFRDCLEEATDEQLIDLAEVLAQVKETRPPAIDSYLSAIRDMGRELRMGEFLLIRDATQDFIEQSKRDASLADARSAIFGSEGKS